MPEECDILKKAAAYFAKESGRSTPSSVSRRRNTRYDVFARVSTCVPVVTALGWPSRKVNNLISSMTLGGKPGRLKKP